jgi:cell division protein FtsW (lipid II flippase)
VSMGGTSRIMTCISLGIILSVSKDIKEQQVAKNESLPK